MDIGTHFETGTGSVGNYPAFDRKCAEADAAGVSCRTVLGENYETKYVFCLYPCKDGSGIRESQVCGTGFMG